jgi:signal transduction histidine kinase/membrane-associated phospholipid phosphatase/ActR/RegA family two-component response regulator
LERASGAQQPTITLKRRFFWLVALFLVQALYIPINRNMTGGVVLFIRLDNFVPLWPIWVLPYLLILLFWAACFVWAAFKMEDRLYRAFVAGMLFTFLTSYVVYIVFPTYVIRPTVEGADWASNLIRNIYANDRLYNAFPSGHTYTTLLIVFFWWKWKPKLRWLWVTTGAIVVISTLFTGQHHVLDLFGGILWAWFGYRFGLWWSQQEPVADFSRNDASIWLWRIIWAGSILFGLSIFFVYARFPADGSTGDLESFSSGGFRIQWILEPRSNNLIPGDQVIKAGDPATGMYTTDEWLSGASRGPEWEDGGTVLFEILRDGQIENLRIQLRSISNQSVRQRWSAQLLISIGLILVGSYVFFTRPHEHSARLLMLFCLMVAVQIWGDTYNFQYATIPRRTVFWYHFFVENSTFILIYASILNFTMVFPEIHPLIKQHPRKTTLAIYLSHPLAVSIIMLLTLGLTQSWSTAIRNGSRTSWFVALIQLILAFSVAIWSARRVRAPVPRAQIRWIVWGAVIVMAMGIPGYMLPILITGRPFIPHPIVMLLTAFIIIVFAIPILRFRLFDIEIVTNRTLVYGTLTATLITLFFLLVRILTLMNQIVFQDLNETMVVFISTLSIALAFNPLRQRLQETIDRAFFKQKLNFRRLTQEMMERVANTIELQNLSSLLTDEFPKRLQIKNASLLVLDQSDELLEAVNKGSYLQTLSIHHPVVQMTILRKHPLVRLQPPDGISSENLRWLDNEGIEICFPLFVGDNFVGLYTLGPKLSADGYNREEIHLLHLLGRQAAVNVQNSRLLRSEKEQRKLAEALQDAAEVVNSSLDIERVLDHILEQVSLVVEGDAFNTMLIKGDDALVVRRRGYEQFYPNEEDLRQIVYIAELPYLVRMVEDGLPVLVPDTAKDPKWVVLDNQEWLRSYVAAPIRIGERTIGFLNVNGSQPNQFTIADSKRLEAFALHAGVALQNARLFEERMDLLVKTQQQAYQVQQIIDTVPEGVILLDAERRIMLANPVARNMLIMLDGEKYPNQPLFHIAGHPIDILFDSYPEQPWIELSWEGPPKSIFEAAVRPVQSDEGGAAWVLVLRDVTVERETRAQIHMQERLSTVGQLAAGITHDFNNIMAAILVLSDLLNMDSGISDESRERLKIIQSQIQRASSLTRQILDFSRNSAIEKNEIDLLQFFRDLEKLLRRVLPEYVRLELEYRRADYTVLGDSTSLQQVFMNLALNARDAMSNGGSLLFELGQIKILPGDVPPLSDLSPGVWITIGVHDTGTGIPTEILPRIFDPFFTTKPIGKGTGLGLSQVYGIIKQHGGSIDVESQAEKGTSFFIYLPAMVGGAKSELKPEIELEISGSGETILVVEDDNTTCEAVRDLLKNLNYRVLTASSGQEALQVYQQKKENITLVISDVVMPEMGGLSMYKAIIEKAPNTKFVFISGHPIELEEVEMSQNDHVRWVRKPFSAQSLSAVVSEMMENNG